MAVMAAAADAVVLDPRVDQVVVLLGLEDPRDGGEEARPAGAGLELHLGGEERQAAAGAGEDPRALLVVQRAGARALGAFLAHDVEGLGGQLLLPFVLGELHRLRGGGARSRPGGESFSVFFSAPLSFLF